jgi:hypothetical protein
MQHFPSTEEINARLADEQWRKEQEEREYHEQYVNISDERALQIIERERKFRCRSKNLTLRVVTSFNENLEVPPSNSIQLYNVKTNEVVRVLDKSNATIHKVLAQDDKWVTTEHRGVMFNRLKKKSSY